MEIKINSQKKEITSPLTLLECLSQHQIETSFVAVAVNFVCIPKEKWDTHLLKDQDEIEILSPQSGG